MGTEFPSLSPSVTYFKAEVESHISVWHCLLLENVTEWLFVPYQQISVMCGKMHQCAKCGKCNQNGEAFDLVCTYGKSIPLFNDNLHISKLNWRRPLCIQKMVNFINYDHCKQQQKSWRNGFSFLCMILTFHEYLQDIKAIWYISCWCIWSINWKIAVTMSSNMSSQFMNP